jgi:hypothetical protein
MRQFQPSFEQFESRFLPTLVFIFDGNAFAEAKPNQQLTQTAAQQLMALDDHAVQMTTPAMTSPAAFYQVAAQIQKTSKGQPIGLLGFSAGGTLALRLSSIAGLNVRAALSYYGPPDFADWLNFHRGDRFYRKVTSMTHFSAGIVKLLSGVSYSNAQVIDVFGMRDKNVVSSQSTASFYRDFPDGRVYHFSGGHGVNIYADYPAFKDFVSHL